MVPTLPKGLVLHKTSTAPDPLFNPNAIAASRSMVRLSHIALVLGLCMAAGLAGQVIGLAVAALSTSGPFVTAITLPASLMQAGTAGAWLGNRSVVPALSSLCIGAALYSVFPLFSFADESTVLLGLTECSLVAGTIVVATLALGMRATQGVLGR
jgi:hypothetical protein